jgi:hypothetical protein
MQLHEHFWSTGERLLLVENGQRKFFRVKQGILLTTVAYCYERYRRFGATYCLHLQANHIPNGRRARTCFPSFNDGTHTRTMNLHYIYAPFCLSPIWIYNCGNYTIYVTPWRHMFTAQCKWMCMWGLMDITKDNQKRGKKVSYIIFECETTKRITRSYTTLCRMRYGTSWGEDTLHSSRKDGEATYIEMFYTHAQLL